MKLLLISGFLGSGKTTLILSLARDLVQSRGKKVAIIVNEVGEIGVDDKVMKKANLNVWEIFSGCICCQLSVDLVTTLHKLSESDKPDLVLVEASGVANPANVIDVLRYYRGEPLETVRTVVLVDPGRLEMLMEVLTPLVTSQVGAADLVLINKVDQASPEELGRAGDIVGSLNPRAATLMISAKEGLNTESLLQELIG